MSENTLHVLMNNRVLGTLFQSNSGLLEFRYEKSWLDWENTRPISLSLPLTEAPYTGERVYHFFDNLLPDNEGIRHRIQKHFGIKRNHCFDLLKSIGHDCIGAIQLLENITEISNERITATTVTDQEIATLLKNYRTSPLGMDVIRDFRISIAGAQEKTALLKHNNHWKIPSGTTPTTHIFKLPIGYIEHANMDLTASVENEWLCLKILEAFGLPVCQTEIHHFADVKVLVVERFDRQWVNDYSWVVRLPQEDFCQALAISSALKYEADGGPGIKTIMEVLQGSENTLNDRHQFMKTVFLFWVLGAIDGHAKNFSIYLKAREQFHLTPIYDVISAYPLAIKRQLDKQKMKMAMSVQGKSKHYHWASICIRHWLTTAAECRFPQQEMQYIIDFVYDNLDKVINTITSKVPKNFSQQTADSIFQGMREALK